MIPKSQHQRIFWLCGSTCGGKTTVSSAVAAQLNWNVYHLDEWEDEHRARADAKRHPKWFAYSHLTGDPLWLQSVDQHVRDEELALDEQFDLILEDLAACLNNDSRPLIFDGYASPKKLLPFLPSNKHCLYLVASAEFQRRQYEQRPFIHSVLATTSDPLRAWENWIERDRRAARRLEQQVQELEIPWLAVDGSRGLVDTVAYVVKHFQN